MAYLKHIILLLSAAAQTSDISIVLGMGTVELMQLMPVS